MKIPDRLTGPSPARLTVSGLAWGPPGHGPIIENLGFSVAAGEMLAVVGPNGAGKSSLLRCLYRFHRPGAGHVHIDGADIWTLPPRAFARRVATVLQESASDFGLTVAEIVELGLTPHQSALSGHDYTPVEQALGLMELTHLAARDFATLSGGEKQRAMIARALVQRPDLLILDEPTNHLDIRHQLEVLSLLARLSTTVIVSLHDLALASAHADRILVLEHGRQVALGAPLDVLTPHAIRSVFSVGAAIDHHPVTGQPRFSFHLDRSFEGDIK
ncbi:ABC transporter ATP-binding protein [Devosia honganensis]|uniref:ABC transporter ATP-binding protein n=1 Tax=Devosia honganensis TaxID=1610527 RepID=A0ABV7WWA1_9HYPH